MNPKVFDIVSILALFAISPARAITHNYSLNGTLAEDSGTGPSLVA